VKLNEMIADALLDFWAYIEHLPEQDEKKRHKHLYLVPSKLIDTAVFQKRLQEIDTTDLLAKPLGCIVPVSSKFADWFLYSKHDKSYLTSKGQYRKYQYNDTDFIVSCQDYFKHLIHSIDYSKYSLTQRLIDALQDGETPQSLIISGQVPLPMINNFLKLSDFIRYGSLYRDGRSTHTPKVNEETGEIIED
jgi:hypothetical protein